MQADQELSLHAYCPEVKFDETESETAKISFQLTEKLKIEESQPHREFEDDEEEETEDDDVEEDGDDFSFASVSEELISPVAADKVFQDGQIRTIFPVFNRDLLLDGNSSPSRLPTRPPVDKVFIESPRRPSNASENDEIEGIAAGPYCTWTKPAASEFGGKKSNSTGFSKLWRFKERINRSHSDGRDAFVFLNNSSTSSTSSSSSLLKREEKLEKKLSSSSDKKAKVNENGGKAKSSKKGGKKKLTSLSPHEAYLRIKLTEEDRRRSYLPYRPELMGFFTNVHGGGLTKKRSSLLMSTSSRSNYFFVFNHFVFSKEQMLV